MGSFVFHIPALTSITSNVGREWEKGSCEVFTEVMLVGAKLVFQAVFRNQVLQLSTESGNYRG